MHASLNEVIAKLLMQFEPTKDLVQLEKKSGFKSLS